MTCEGRFIQRWFPRLIVCLMAGLLWLSCGQSGVSDDGDGFVQSLPKLPADQAILFEVGYVNGAWGYRCEGWYIDGSGRRYSYHYEHDDDPWRPENHEAITEQELLEKFSHGAEFLGVVDPAEVAASKALIPASAVGTMSDVARRCADFGTARYLAYVRDDSTLTYRTVLLYQHGDMAYRNLSVEARTLFDWLREVSDQRGEIPCPAPE
ncbi:MAG: hypothetical protein OEV49_15850 [candidate division Zixibacteria bacterium]|nr:hypothetical protein [candidate division Zixibacteria bacterium]MDH3937453.1 hypothetical protein [candidate division Zixibacteria bacterium]MDH4034412.1 hypothetical protein [candidate division Zixibacteria bacterium]